MAAADSLPSVSAAARQPVQIVHTELRKGSVGLAGVLMQSIAQISPTLGVFYTIAFTTTQAGMSAPLTYLAAFAICLVLSVPMLGLARHLPSAGGFYTYVSQGIGPRTGFMTGWLYAIMVTIVPAALAAFTGAVLHDELSAKYDIGLPWWTYALAIFADLLRLRLPRHRHLGPVLVVMTIFEIIVGLSLALTGVFRPGPGGVNVTGFNPAHIGSSSGFFLAIVLSIFAFTGFESAAAVATSPATRNDWCPRRSSARWRWSARSTSSAPGACRSAGAPTTSRRWPTHRPPRVRAGRPAVERRLDHRPDRAGQLRPRRLRGLHHQLDPDALRHGPHRCAARNVLARVSQKHRTPIVAVYVQVAVAVAICLAVGLPMGPYNLFNLLGTTGTFAYIPIFILMNVAAYLFFRRQHPEEFSVLRYVVCPIISTVALLVIGYKSVVPLPAMPVASGPGHRRGVPGPGSVGALRP